MDKLRNDIKAVFLDAFGRTPLKLRIEDIASEASELARYTDLANLKEETGDLLASTLMLCYEAGWKPEDLILSTLIKIQRRKEQYASLGRKKKVAIIGGAFDPPHIGHIGVAKIVLDAVNMFDEVWLMPCFKHMFGKKMASYKDRVAMCKAATATDLRIRVSEFERDLAGESYYLVQRLLEFYHDEYDFSLVIGLDNANGFEKWVNSEHLERLIRFVVVQRQEENIDNTITWYRQSPHIFIPNEGVIPDISSTRVRGWLHASEEGNFLYMKQVQQFVPEGVITYIKEHKLYGSPYLKDLQRNIR